MSKRTIVTMPGDGIGKPVLDETIRVLEAAGLEVTNSFWLVVDKVEKPTAVLYSFTNQQIFEMRKIYDSISKRLVKAIDEDYFPTYAEEFGNEIGAVELELVEYFNRINR